MGFLKTAVYLLTVLILSVPCNAAAPDHHKQVKSPGLYRTFTMDSLATPIAVKKKPFEIQSSFTFTNESGTSIDRIVIYFMQPVVSILQYDPFTDASSIDDFSKVWELTGATLEDGESADIVATGEKPRVLLLSRIDLYFEDGFVKTQRVKKQDQPFASSVLYDLPNTANVRDEVFRRQPFTLSGGLIIGIPRPDSAKYYAWAVISKSSDLKCSLMDKSGYQSNRPKGFTVFENGNKVTGMQKHPLTPSKYNNCLYGELITLKMNIAASDLGITPDGFPDLLFDEDENPLSGLQVRDIAAYADSAMTYWRNRPKEQYDNLYATIHEINAAFTGSIDTICYTDELCLTGIDPDPDMTYLSEIAGANHMKLLRGGAKRHHDNPDNSISGMSAVPLAFALNQNYPNPFNPSTVISFILPVQSLVTLKIYSIIGQEIAALYEGELLNEGPQSAVFDGSRFASGTYLYKITAQQLDADHHGNLQYVMDTKRMLLVK
jgi:hypothetical protein